MRIGQLASQSGVPTTTIRFYEQRGLLPPAKRLASGYRHYNKQALDKLLLIKFSQSLGFALDELPTLVNKQGEWEHEHILQRLQQKQQEVNDLLKQLNTKKEKLELIARQLQQHWQSGECMPQEKLSAIINENRG